MAFWHMWQKIRRCWPVGAPTARPKALCAFARFFQSLKPEVFCRFGTTLLAGHRKAITCSSKRLLNQHLLLGRNPGFSDRRFDIHSGFRVQPNPIDSSNKLEHRCSAGSEVGMYLRLAMRRLPCGGQWRNATSKQSDSSNLVQHKSYLHNGTAEDCNCTFRSSKDGRLLPR